MKQENNKQAYREPDTHISVVECEGFLCVSLVDIKFKVELDEHVNCELESLDFNSDW